MSLHPCRTQVQEAITANADYHARLCAIISDLKHVPISKEEQSAMLRDIKQQVASSGTLVAELAKRTAKERQEYESLRDSKGRRFVHGIVGQKQRFEVKRNKEEREYVDALEMEMKERDNCQALKKQLDQTQKYILDLDELQKVYITTTSERDALYSDIFDSSLESKSDIIPEQTSLKDALMEAQHNHNTVQQLLDVEHKASECLSQAIKKADMCEKYISEAQNNSGYEMWPAALTAFSKVQDAIKNAQATAVQVTTLVDKAMRMSPAVMPVGNIDVQESILLNGLNFTNFLIDVAFAAKLRQAKAQILQIKARLLREWGAASSRATCTAQALTAAADKVDECRGSLTDARRAIFDKYLDFTRCPHDEITSVEKQ